MIIRGIDTDNFCTIEKIDNELSNINKEASETASKYAKQWLKAEEQKLTELKKSMLKYMRIN